MNPKCSRCGREVTNIHNIHGNDAVGTHYFCVRCEKLYMRELSNWSKGLAIKNLEWDKFFMAFVKGEPDHEKVMFT